MRINPDPTADLLAAINRNRRAQSDALQQLASGRRINVASDDPATSALLVQNSSRASQTDEFLHSLVGLKAQFQTADATLNSVVLALQQAITLGMEGGTETVNASNRVAIAEQVSGIQKNILGLANLSFNGNYLFAGTATQAAPFVEDATAPSGIRYAGNNTVNNVMIGDKQSIAMNVPGSKLFAAAGADVFQSLHDLQAALTGGTNDDIASATAAVRAAFDHVTAQRVFYGNALSQFEGQTTFLNSEKLQWTTRAQQLAGADTAETITKITNAQSAADATMSATAKLLRTSLLDYLN